MSNIVKYYQGEKIYLRPLEATDVDFFYAALNNDVEARRLTGTQTFFTKTQVEAYITSQDNDSTRVTFGIVRLEDDVLIGEVVLTEICPKNRSANLRIAVSDAYVNKGYGSEAIRLMLNHGFGILNLNRIELDVYAFNDRAYHVYEKLGFKKEGVRRQDLYYNHQYYDSILMSILKHEYNELYGTNH